jgi:hypothetical protein
MDAGAIIHSSPPLAAQGAPPMNAVRTADLTTAILRLSTDIAFHQGCTSCCQDATPKALKQRTAHKTAMRKERKQLEAQRAAIENAAA